MTYPSPKRPPDRRVTRKHLAAVGALTLASGLLAACSGGSGKTELTWYINPDSGGQDAVAANCSTDAYTVKTQVLPQDAGQQRIQLARRLEAHDAGIDLMSLDPPYTAEFANAGLLATIPDDVQDAIKNGGGPADGPPQAFQGAVDAATWEDKVVAFPFWSNTQVLWYRKDAAEAAGLDMTQPVTWDQIIDASVKLNQDQGANNTKIGVQANKYEGYVVWINALISGAGGSIIEDPSKGADAPVTINSPAGEDAAAVIEKLASSTAAEPDLSVSNEGTVLGPFWARDAKGNVIPDAGGFNLNWTFVYTNYQGLVGLSPAEGGISEADFANLGWARYPETVAGEDSRPPYGGIGLGVSAYSDDKEDALKAAACITNADNQGVNAELTGNMPASRAGYEYPALQKIYPADLLQLFQESVDAAAPRTVTPYWSDISSSIQSTWHPAASVTDATPAKSADFMEEVLQGKRLL
jgi:multiple sugar transport system substrate-binding protein